MSEDYTYPTTPTLADLRNQVAELERENAELRGKLDAVPVGAFLLYYRESKPTSARAESVMNILTDWMRQIYDDMERQIRANLEASE